MVQQTNLKIKLNKDIARLLLRCETHKFKILHSTDLLLFLDAAFDVSRPAYVLLRKISGHFYAKDNFDDKLSKDAQ